MVLVSVLVPFPVAGKILPESGNMKVGGGHSDLFLTK